MFALLCQRNFTLLWLSGFISIIGDWVLQIGLPIYVYIITKLVLATSTTFIAGIVPKTLLGTVADVFMDHWKRKQVMIVSNLLLTACLLLLLLFHSIDWLWVVYLVMSLQYALILLKGGNIDLVSADPQWLGRQVQLFICLYLVGRRVSAKA